MVNNKEVKWGEKKINDNFYLKYTLNGTVLYPWKEYNRQKQGSYCDATKKYQVTYKKIHNFNYILEL